MGDVEPTADDTRNLTGQETHDDFLVKFGSDAAVLLIVVDILPLWPHIKAL